MSIDYGNARELASLGGSVLALASTLYFWLIRANRERARLAAHLIGDMQGSIVTPHRDLAVYHRLKPASNEHCLKYWLHIAVVNNSSLPNALLGARVSIQFKDGAWRTMEVRHVDDQCDLFPVNLSSLSTSSLKLALATTYADAFEQDHEGRAAAAGDALPRTVPIRIELIGLQNKSFVYELMDTGNGLQRTGNRSQSAAA
jgi:hypothetical protein